jgi:5-methylcytosine-specific restriction endonuclease McrA
VETLLLNASYEPMRRISIKRAVKLLLKGVVEVVEEYETGSFVSLKLTFKLPSVVRLISYVSWRSKGVRFNRSNVYQRDNGTCQYCGKKVTTREFTYEHVIPRSKGGASTWENIVVACVPCNQKKGGRTPQEAGMKLLSQPRRPTKAFQNIIVGLTYDKSMPISWRKFLGDLTYWNAELEA